LSNNYVTLGMTTSGSAAKTSVASSAKLWDKGAEHRNKEGVTVLCTFNPP
jgi:hypothetical protein